MNRQLLDDLKAHVDLVELVSQTVTLKKRGSTYMGFCPFHENTRTPAFAVFPKTQTWRCFGACATGGDVFTFVMKRDGLTFTEAVAQLARRTLSLPVKPRAPEPVHTPNTPPSAQWQATGWRLIERAEQMLWKPDDQALRYLHEERMLKDETLKRWRIGVIPRDSYMPFSAWGLPDEPERRGVWLPAGVVIPTFTTDGNLWAIHVRRWKGKPKYLHIRGSKKSLWGTQNVVGQPVVMICAGEFDAMLAQQEGGHLVGCCSPTTGEGSTWASEWTSLLLLAEKVIVTYDSDAAGEMGAWRNMLTQTNRIIFCSPPILEIGNKDLTDFIKLGGTLKTLLIIKP